MAKKKKNILKKRLDMLIGHERTWFYYYLDILMVDNLQPTPHKANVINMTIWLYGYMMIQWLTNYSSQ